MGCGSMMVQDGRMHPAWEEEEEGADDCADVDGDSFERANSSFAPGTSSISWKRLASNVTNMPTSLFCLV